MICPPNRNCGKELAPNRVIPQGLARTFLLCRQRVPDGVEGGLAGLEGAVRIVPAAKAVARGSGGQRVALHWHAGERN